MTARQESQRQDLPDIGLANRRAISLADVSVEPVEDFRERVAGAVGNGWRIASFFGCAETDDRVRLVAVLADDERGRLWAGCSVVGESYPSVAAICSQASRFEREIAEQCDVTPSGHPALTPLRRHLPDHAPVSWLHRSARPVGQPYRRFEGEEVHEVAVGPVHAGIIEPGHFRFQAHGEVVLQLDIELGYQHRGVERLLEGADRVRAVILAESIDGTAAIGHASACCGAIEALARSRKSPRAQSIRGIALELERLANHFGDLGALAGDVAFQTAAAFFGRLRGECLNLLMTIAGNRLGRGLIRPGGALFDLPPAMASEVRARIARLTDEAQPIGRLLFESASVQSRFEGVGVVTRTTCVEQGFVGIVARSCDVARDVRHDFPYGIFRFVHVPVTTAWAGDVFARAHVRWIEIQRSLEFIAEQIAALPGGPTQVPCGELRPSELAVSMEEGWRGEIVHVVITDANGRVRRHKVTDPSFHNWPALEACIPGNQISDFPLCNKSFNLSYAGHDL